MKDQIKSILIGLVTIGALLATLWFFLDAAFRSINQLQSAVAASIIAATIAAVTAFFVNVYVKHRESKEKIIQEIRAKKTPVYEELIDIFFSLMLADKLGREPVSPEELSKRFAEITPKLIIWGSEEMIDQWNQIRTHNWQSGETPMEIFRPWNDFFTHPPKRPRALKQEAKAICIDAPFCE